MKRAVIVHCWDGHPAYCWYPQAKRDLEAAGFDVTVPAMPETGRPRLSLWLPKLREVVGVPDASVYLIGHSVGCVTILHYLGSLQPGQRVGGVVLVAGYTDDLGYAELKNFFVTPIDYEKARRASRSFTLIHSDDDPYVPLFHGEVLKEKLAATLIVKHAMKHFSGPLDNEASCVSLPNVTQAILEMQ